MEGTFWNGYLLFELGPNLLHKAAAKIYTYKYEKWHQIFIPLL